MADFIADRGDDTVLIAVRIPKQLWDTFEYRHPHYGKAIFAIRETVTELLAAHCIHRVPYEDKGDPFYRHTAGS